MLLLVYLFGAYLALELIEALILAPFLGWNIGVVGGAESMFEGFMYLITFYYWKNKNKD